MAQSPSPNGSSDDNVVTLVDDGREVWEIPADAPTRYLSHDYFRYVGKFAPQIARTLISRYSKPGSTVVDPMCGGGTTLIEASLVGRKAVGSDINPVARLVSRVATTPIQPAALAAALEDLEARVYEFQFSGCRIPGDRELFGHEDYFDDLAFGQLSFLQDWIDRQVDLALQEWFQVGLLSTLRRVSRANVKKMNTEIDETKVPRPVFPTLLSKLRKMEAVNRSLDSELKGPVEVMQSSAESLEIDDLADLVIVHPPYLTNTAFSEVVQLPLAWLGVNHKSVWKQELRCRGSFLHEPNGLQKYLVNWFKILNHLSGMLASGGHIGVVIGDGRIDRVRIPMAAITKEYAIDLGLSNVVHAVHVFNNNTGRTLSHRMKEEHVLVFSKP